MAATAQFSTKDRILGAAEELFAQHGFAGTSLRQVTTRADVNIAAVNYHFGSKENLVNEVFRRRIDGVMVARSYVMMDYDIRVERVDAAVALTPGIESPTVSPLHREGWVAVRSMVRRDDGP